MKHLLLLSLLMLPLVAAQAQQKVIPAQSEIGFVVKQMGVPVDGKFNKFDAQVTFDPAKPDAGKISMTIDLASAAIGDAETAKELKTADWFNTAKFPIAAFSSGTIKPAGPGKFDVAGSLTIKGVSKPVLVPVSYSKSGANAVAQGSFTIKRSDFKIGEGDWTDTSIVAAEVLVKFKLTLAAP